MKKLFTFALAFIGFAGVANASNIDDVAVCKHSYVLCFDDWDGNGTAKPGKGSLFGNGFFLDVTGGSVSTGKGKVNLSVVNEADDNHVTQYIADKYGADYPEDHFNSWRLKNAQDVIAMKVTAKTKLIFFLQGNNKSGKDARIPKIATDEKLENALNEAPGEDFPTTDSGFRYEWTAPDDMTIYIGTYNGDTFFSYLIVEANEAPGTPTVKVGEQQYQAGLWFKEVTCKANPATEEGSTEQIPTLVTYTTDGTTPTADSPIYTEPIKCYKEMTVKFQAFLDIDGGKANADFLCDGADNEANVNFKFDAPTINVDGPNVSIVSPYADQGGTNFYSINGGENTKGDAVTLTESATVTAYTIITNGDYALFTSMPTTKDVYVLNAIKEAKTIAITAGDVVVDDEATANDPNNQTVYKVENGAISADKVDFFVKNLEFGVVKDEKFQVPAGEERYIKMNTTNISFLIAEGDSVNVKVTCSKNSCKNMESETENDRKCYVNVSGTNYCHKDAEGNEAADITTTPDANIIEFGLKGAEGGSIFTFQKYSGTGNIFISSIEITPAEGAPVDDGDLVINSDCSTNDVTSYWVHEWRTNDVQTDGPANIVDGCVKVYVRSEAQAEAAGNATHTDQGGFADWDSQFFITWPADKAGQAGDKLQLKMRVKADNAQSASSQCHTTPGAYIFWYCVGDVNFTTDWTDFDSGERPIIDGEQWGNAKAGLHTIAFNLAKGAENNIYFDDMHVWITNPSGIKQEVMVRPVSGIRYNLAGQKVSESYKGVVIMNGKKFVQK